MKVHKQKGLAMPIILGLVLVLSIWVASISWQMTNSRSAYQRSLQSRQAYLLARAGIEHFLLKVKTMQRQSHESMMAIEQANAEEHNVLSRTFLEDIVILPDNQFTATSHSYIIKEYAIESIDSVHGILTMRVVAEGSFGSEKNVLSRLFRLSR